MGIVNRDILTKSKILSLPTIIQFVLFIALFTVFSFYIRALQNKFEMHMLNSPEYIGAMHYLSDSDAIQNRFGSILDTSLRRTSITQRWRQGKYVSDGFFEIKIQGTAASGTVTVDFSPDPEGYSVYTIRLP